MTIQFLPVAEIEVDGSGGARLLLGTRGLDNELAAAGAARLTLRALGSGQVFFGGGVDPPIPASGSASLVLRVAGEGYERSFGNGAASISVRAKGYAALPNQGAGGAYLEFNARGRQLTASAAFAGLEERPAMVSGFGGRWFLSPRSALVLGEQHSNLPTHVLQDALAFRASRRSSLLATCVSRDGLSFDDALAVVYFVLLEEGVSFGPSVRADAGALERTVDRLLLLGAADSYADAINSVIGGIWFGAVTEALRTVTVVDGVLAGGVVGSLQRAAERLVDRLLAESAAFGTGTGVALVSDQLTVGGQSQSTADLVQLLRDGLGFVTRLALDTGEYVAWVMNTESRALSRYTNYPFNSFAKIGGRYYAAAADGLHRLEGDDDDGVPIAARVRLGLSAMGTRREKRVPEAFVGYTSDGALLLHVISVNEKSGLKEAAIYRILERPASSPRETRWKLGKGIKAVDFDFIIENVNGSDFDLSALEFRPIYLDRRTRG